MYQWLYLISDISGQKYTFHDQAMADLSSPDRHITAKDMKCLKEAFALFDRDRDGEINTANGRLLNPLYKLMGKQNCTLKSSY